MIGIAICSQNVVVTDKPPRIETNYTQYNLILILIELMDGLDDHDYMLLVVYLGHEIAHVFGSRFIAS